MEFIGLLGLIGLFGLVARSDVRKKIEELRKEFSRKVNQSDELEKRVAKSEKNLDSVERDVNRINSTLQNFATTDALDKLNRRVESDLAEMKVNPPRDRKVADSLTQLNENFKTLQDDVKNFKTTADELKATNKNFDARLKQVEAASPDESAKNFERRVAVLESERQMLIGKIAEQNSYLQQHQAIITQFRTRLDEQESRLKKLEGATPDNSAKIFEQRIAVLEAERQNLLKKNSDLEARLKKLEEATPDESSKIFEQRIAVLETERQNLLKKISELETRLEKLEKATPARTLTIRDFNIKKTSEKIFFANEPGELPKRIAAVQDLSSLTTFLKGANFDKRDGFLSIVDNYKKNLERFAAKVKRGKFDEDSLSEEVTRNFFSTLSKYFLAPLMTAILRGGKDNPEIYSKLLGKVNEYLSACNVYTELVEPGKLMRSSDVNNMQITPKKTDNRAKDKLVDEVEQLPYFMSYLTEDGDEDFFCCEGKMVVLKFDGGK